ncbi:hypothetical protein TIFTF001_044643 [Ficus carica]|uniref:Uncharacterized protein n=1 Tax=Ficus carica TaxID=3494 RepID=A0AA87Z847_FICCA|nr:hypothetical protein TIFTF001_044643 [Ficus carica]
MLRWFSHIVRRWTGLGTPTLKPTTSSTLGSSQFQRNIFGFQLPPRYESDHSHSRTKGNSTQDVVSSFTSYPIELPILSASNPRSLSMGLPLPSPARPSEHSPGFDTT